MDTQSTRDDGEIMDVDEPTRPVNATNSTPVSESQVRRPVPLLPSLSRSDQDTRPYPPRSPKGYPDQYHHRRTYESSRSTAPLSQRHYPDQDYLANRATHEYPDRYEQRYDSRYSTERQGYRMQEQPSSEYYPRSSRDIGPSYSPRGRSRDDRDSDYSGQHSPRTRPLHRDPRDRSPRSYPHYPREDSTFSHRDPAIELLDRFERRPPSPRRSTDFRSHHDIHLHHRDSPDPRYVTREEYHERGSRLSDGRHGSPREFARRERDQGFTFAHRSPHARVRSMEEPREPRLPPARHLLSVSPDLMMPTRSHPRDSATREPIDRSHSAGERLIRPAEMDYSSLWRRSSFQSPEDILDGMRDSHRRRGPDYPPLDRNHSPLRHPIAEIAAMEELEARRLREARPATPPSTRSHGVASVAPRTGFPSSGMRSTAPPTPPVPRITQIDSAFAPRFPGPSLGPIPPVPARNSQPTSSAASTRPRIVRSRTEPNPNRSAAPSPVPLRRRSTSSLNKRQVTEMIMASVQIEEPPKSSRSGSAPPPNVPPVRAKSPPRNILAMSLPGLVSTENLPRTSARVLLVPPPFRDDLQNRTKEQDRAYAEWLFDGGTNVQRCLVRAVALCETDILRAVDELMVITHWIVTYMHQLGLSYHSPMRHVMRVAFWGKLNWAWFCVIEASLNESRQEINGAEIEPFPDAYTIRVFSEGEMDVDTSVVKREEGPSSTAQSSDQDTISEPMEEVVAQLSISDDLPEQLQQYWRMAKRLNGKTRWPSHMGEDEWIKVGDILIEFGSELFKYGLLDMDLGFAETEIMHRIGGLLDAWRNREMAILRIANTKFRNLGDEQRKAMIMAVKDDEKGINESRR